MIAKESSDELQEEDFDKKEETYET